MRSPLASRRSLRARHRAFRPVGHGHYPLAGHRHLLHRLDQINYGYIAVFYVLAATLFSISYRPGKYAPAAPAVEMALSRRLAGGRPVHASLRDSVPARCAHAQPAHQAGRPVSGISPADLLLGHHPLPIDGHGPDLQARRGIHTGDCDPARRLLRRHRAHRRHRPPALPESIREWA